MPRHRCLHIARQQPWLRHEPGPTQRLLYADANPATLVDPDGHFAGDANDERGRVPVSLASCSQWGYNASGKYACVTGRI